MDIKEVKEEIKKDEELLVKIFKLEKFIKKYKRILISFFVILFAFILGYYGYDYYKTQTLIKANNLLQEALINNNEKIIKELKNYPKAYNLYLLKKDISKVNSKELEEIKAYKLAVKKGDIKSLEEYLNNPDYHILKNEVRLILVRLYLEKKERQKALIYANEIPQTSEFKKFATFLIHYGIVK